MKKIRERSNIKFPLWRKKVDGSLLEGKETPIPKFLWPGWNIETLFKNINSKNNNKSLITIHFKGNTYIGSITHTIKTNKYRLHLSKEVSEVLKDTYTMSYMRYIEDKLRNNKQQYQDENIEEEIPFWEFLDIEFDSTKKTFYFNAHYVQKPIFIELFTEIVKSQVLGGIEDQISHKEGVRIQKGNWKKKSELNKEIDAKNVIYNLIDTTNKQIYIGETESLKYRFKSERHEIPNWDFYRFDSLPNDLSKDHRVAIERLLIRTMASFLENLKSIDTMNISNYKLVNKKIDK